MDAAPIPLAYDDLPSGSEIRREYSPQGVRIVVPPGEVLPEGMHQAQREALVWGALSSIPLILLGGVIFYLLARLNRIDGRILFFAWGFFGLFCAALVMLLARERYGKLTDGIRLGRQQMTVLVARPSRLLIATTGPFGGDSYDLPGESVRRLLIQRTALLDEFSRRHILLHLMLEFADGRSIRLLPGRDRAELQTVAATLKQALQIPEEVRPA
jgi:hypothetical protein